MRSWRQFGGYLRGRRLFGSLLAAGILITAVTLMLTHTGQPALNSQHFYKRSEPSRSISKSGFKSGGLISRLNGGSTSTTPDSSGGSYGQNGSGTGGSNEGQVPSQPTLPITYPPLPQPLPAPQPSPQPSPVPQPEPSPIYPVDPNPKPCLQPEGIMCPMTNGSICGCHGCGSGPVSADYVCVEGPIIF